ncbi:Transmembrane protein 180 (Major facilitator superfamily domain-containing 13A) [Durusdinium trenchii]|uniref:Transmembrane protein 180 (Major facilitator superfamily domain-containing 13A) n=1 Tax=Durusdinium trenchii TaxID=1381693 RepID=A0ABP0S7Q1_9DINO
MAAWWGQPKAHHVGFGLVMLASSAMNNLFVTYYLDLFMNVVQLGARSFYLGQLVFMVWNATNDPIFGWLSDRVGLRGADAGKKSPLGRQQSNILRRLAVIRTGGLLWCLAFVLIWFPPSRDYVGEAGMGLHFMLALCFYDGMLTLVEVNHSAILAEISSDSSERATMNAYSAVGAGLGSMSSLAGHALWARSEADLWGFRAMSVALALVCGLSFEVGCRLMQRHARQGYNKASRLSAEDGVEEIQCSACGPGVTAEGSSSSSATLRPGRSRGRGAGASTGASTVTGPGSEATVDGERGAEDGSVTGFLRQLLQQRNFWVFQALYFVQAFDCTFGKNHFSLFLDALAGRAFSAEVLGAIISASFILPWVGTLVVTPLIHRRGLYAVVSGILVTRLLWCAGGAALGPQLATPALAAAFVLSNRVLSEAVCRVCPLVISDLVDEDRFLHRRSASASATIVGGSTLLGKASQSLAPMLGFSLLRSQQGGGAPAATGAADQAGLLSLLVLLPLCCVGAQLLLWRLYSLRGRYLARVKAAVAHRGTASIV